MQIDGLLTRHVVPPGDVMWQILLCASARSGPTRPARPPERARVSCRRAHGTCAVVAKSPRLSECKQRASLGPERPTGSRIANFFANVK